MNTKAKLPPEIAATVDDLLRKAGEADRAKDIEQSEAFALAAWEALPEPKLNWDFYSNIMPRDNLLFFRDIGQYDKALRWLDVTRESYGPGRNEVVEFQAATLWFAMGDLDKAYEEFDRQFKAGKTRPFQGEDKKYLDFYLSRKKQK